MVVSHAVMLTTALVPAWLARSPVSCVGEQSDDDGLRAVFAQLEAAEPVRPVVVGDAVDADLVAGRPP